MGHLFRMGRQSLRLAVARRQAQHQVGGRLLLYLSLWGWEEQGAGPVFPVVVVRRMSCIIIIIRSSSIRFIRMGMHTTVAAMGMGMSMSQGGQV